MERVKDLDLYLLLEIPTDADDNVIKKAYRKKALKCHPDKNPDNPKAAATFHQLTDALAVLTDESARKAYDNLLKARKANELRNRQLDAKRKKLKDDLEAREKAAAEKASETVLAGEKLAREIERLQKEGRRQLEEEQERLRQLIEDEKKQKVQQSQHFQSEATASTKLKVRWKESADSSLNYDSDSLKRIFCKYGDVGEVIVMASKKKSGSHSGLVEMLSGAQMAVNIEKGFPGNPLKVKLLGGDESAQEAAAPQASTFNNDTNLNQTSQSFDDYESLVMRKMRQEEERKRLIEEIKRQDAEDEK